MTRYIILWKMDAEQDFCFEADVMAKGAKAAEAKFRKMFPKDIVVGVKAS